MKTCSQCSETKPLSEYHVDNRTGTPYAHCTTCHRSMCRVAYQRNLGANRARSREAAAAKRVTDPEPGRAASRKWHSANPNYVRAASKSRRARQLGAEQSSETYGYIISLKTSPQACNWCSKAMPSGAEHVDHVIPLVLGGAHTPSNLVAACAPCNLSKGAQHPDNWSFLL